MDYDRFHRIANHLCFFSWKEGTTCEEQAGLCNRIYRHDASCPTVLDSLVGQALPGCGDGAFHAAYYCRHQSREAYAAYISTPAKLELLQQLTVLAENVVMLDWVSTPASSHVLVGASIFQAAMLKLVEHVDDLQMRQIANDIYSQKSTLPGVLSVSMGRNYSPRIRNSLALGYCATFADDKGWSSFTSSGGRLQKLRGLEEPIKEYAFRVMPFYSDFHFSCQSSPMYEFDFGEVLWPALTCPCKSQGWQSRDWGKTVTRADLACTKASHQVCVAGEECPLS